MTRHLYHQQDTAEFCGEACQQMILRVLNHPDAPRDQVTELHPRNVLNRDDRYYTSPYAMQETLNFFIRDQAIRYRVMACDSLGQATRYVRNTLGLDRTIPSAVLVTGGVHWNVVCDMAGGARPRVCVRDPWPARFTVAQPHADDDSCGGGGDYGAAYRWLEYDPTDTASGWASLLVPDLRGGYPGKYVVVCDQRATSG